jgi:transcriptional regulator with XRE-family HTH domain
MELETALSTILKEKRNHIGISQEELAHRCNIDRTYISMIERGKRKPTLNILFKICDALYIKPSAFIKEVEDLLLPSENNN